MGAVFLPSERKAGMTHLQQRRKNPLPAVRADQGNGSVLLVYGEPHDPCPVAGCRGTLRFLQR